jgi:hypothetical protein
LIVVQDEGMMDADFSPPRTCGVVLATALSLAAGRGKAPRLLPGGA